MVFRSAIVYYVLSFFSLFIHVFLFYANYFFSSSYHFLHVARVFSRTFSFHISFIFVV